jgi:hypothetical protein
VRQTATEDTNGGRESENDERQSIDRDEDQRDRGLSVACQIEVGVGVGKKPEPSHARNEQRRGLSNEIAQPNQGSPRDRVETTKKKESANTALTRPESARRTIVQSVTWRSEIASTSRSLFMSIRRPRSFNTAGGQAFVGKGQGEPIAPTTEALGSLRRVRIP